MSMETRALISHSWDDLVFDNRNRAYGAYLIRKAYTRRLLLSFGVSVAMAALVLLLPTLLKEKSGVLVHPPLPRKGDHTLTEPPIFIPRPMQPPASRPPASTHASNTTIRVVTEQVEEPSTLTETFISSSEDGIEGSEGSDDVQVSGFNVPVEVPVVSTEPVVFAEVMPEYEGGMAELMKFVKRKLNYSAKMRRLGIDGTVYVSFVVNGDGSVSNVKVLRGIHRDCDEEAARVIAMLPGWKGGRQGGNPVAVKMVLPIKFALQ